MHACRSPAQNQRRRRSEPMKIVTILGSRRKRGNTAAVLWAFEALIAPQHETDRINITDDHVEGCRDCDVCQDRLDAPGCLQKDDAVRLLERILAADVIIYAAPVYCWAFPAQLKAVMFDREIAYVRGAVVGKYLPASAWRLVEWIGGGNRSEGVRRLVQSAEA